MLHPSQSQLLALRGAGGLKLPCVYPRQSLHGGLEEAALSEFGIRIRTMKAIHHTRSGDDRGALCVAEWLGDGVQSSDSTWIGIEDLELLNLTEKEHLPVLTRLLCSPNGVAEESLSPGWNRKGWQKQVELWLGEHLGSFDLNFHRTWSISSVARVRTQQENFYFKAVAPHFGAEPGLTTYLAKRFAGQVPDIVAMDEDRGWLLLRDFGGEALHGNDISRWTEAIREFADMQIQCLPHVEEMIDFGFPDRRLERLADHLPGIFSEDQLDLGLEACEIEELRRLQPQLIEWCLELAQLGPPPTLVHGDLHPNNINLSDGRFMFFDWTDAAISHPFVDLVPFHMWDADGEVDRVEQINRAYLEPWMNLLPANTLQRAAVLAKPVGLLYHAQSYFLLVLGIEEDVRWQMERALPALLKRVVEEARTMLLRPPASR